MAEPHDSPPHTFQDVIDEWKQTKPAPMLTFYNITPRADWDGNFTLTYEVTLDGWRYHVQSHVHNTGGTLGPGNSYVPGFKGSEEKTPGFVVGQAPAFDTTIHVHDWSGDSAYKDKLYKGSYRYPTKIQK